MSLSAMPLFARFAVCLAIIVMLLAPATATGEEEDVATTDYKEIPQFEGGWDVYLKYWDGDVSDYAGSFVFSQDRFQLLSINEISLSPILYEVFFRFLQSAPGKIQWEVIDREGSRPIPAFSLFVSADVALTEWGPSNQHIIMIRTPCDFRYSDTASPEIESCSWFPMTGEWLQEAHLTGDCSLTTRCYRLVSSMYRRHFP